MKIINITRKCNECKKSIDIQSDKFLIGGEKTKQFYHKDCYISSRGKRFKTKEAINKFYNITVKSMEEQANIYIKESLAKDRFYAWLYNNYNVCALAKHIFIRISEITSGRYQGLTEPIYYEDLLDMFKRKKKELDNIAYNKERKGKGFNNNVNSRILYDLAVIVAKYDSYKVWKEKQKLYEVDIEEKANEIKVDYNKINKSNDTKEDIDLGDILNDIY